MRSLAWMTMCALGFMACGTSGCGGKETSSDTGSSTESVSSTGELPCDSESNTREDTDTFAAACDCPEDTTPFCFDYPASNGPDGCRRVLLDVRPDGRAFAAGSWQPQLSRDGNVAVFTQSSAAWIPPCDGLAGLDTDVNGHGDIYAMDLRTMTVEVVSVSSQGEQGNGNSESASVSGDGRFVAFWSAATNLVSGVAPPSGGVYVRDREAQTTEIVCVSSANEPANDTCSDAIISATGRYVVFASSASNLVPGGRQWVVELYVRDRELGTTELLSVKDDGSLVEKGQDIVVPVGVSADGRFVAFYHVAALSPLDDDVLVAGNAQASKDLYLRDRTTGKNFMPMLAPNDKHSRLGGLMLSADGRQLLANGDPANYGVELAPGTVSNLIIATFEDDGFSYEAITWPEQPFGYIDFLNAADEALRTFATTVCSEDFVDSMDQQPSGYPVNSNVCLLDRDTGKMSLITASEAGVPGINTGYDLFVDPSAVRMTDYTQISNLSADGKRLVFSTLLHGIVEDNPLICCKDQRHHTYLWDCR